MPQPIQNSHTTTLHNSTVNRNQTIPTRRPDRRKRRIKRIKLDNMSILIGQSKIDKQRLRIGYQIRPNLPMPRHTINQTTSQHKPVNIISGHHIGQSRQRHKPSFQFHFIHCLTPYLNNRVQLGRKHLAAFHLTRPNPQKPGRKLTIFTLRPH